MPVRTFGYALSVTSAAMLALLALLVRPVLAQAPAGNPLNDSAAVVAVAQGVMTAISTGDTVLVRKLLLPGAQLVSIADPVSVNQPGRTQSDAQFINTLATASGRFLERIWNPTVFIHGSLAVVRAPYDFHIDGVFSHCGVDVLTMVKSLGLWRVTHIVYTTQRDSCRASPLGPPRSP